MRADRFDKQLRGSAAPIPGKCGAKLRGTDPPRYCKDDPTVGRTRCRRHGGKTPRGSASPHFRHGRAMRYFGVAPPGLRQHLDPAPLEAIASGRAEISLLDARAAQLLEQLTHRDPARSRTEAFDALEEAERAVLHDDSDRASRALRRLRRFLDEAANEQRAWQEIRDTVVDRTKVARAEIQYQKLLAEKVVMGQLETFIAALVAEAKALPVPRQALSAYVERVIKLGRSIVAIGPGDEEGVVDAEYVDA